MTTKSLITANNNLICALDIETTGLDPEYHEIIQIAILPLDADLQPRTDLPVLDFNICPQHPDRIDYGSLSVSKAQLGEIIATGYHPDKVKELFDMWFERVMKTHPSKKIIPLGHNICQFDLQFIKHWLGGVQTYNYYFHGFARDTMIVATYWNDRNEFQAEQTLFPKLTLKEMARKLEVTVEDEIMHNALYDAWITAQCYRKMCVKLF